MRQAVLLAGGTGSRLSSVSGGLPKPLFVLAGRPFIEHVLDNLVISGGCKRVVIAASYRWELLRDHLGASYKGCELGWSVETQPLGTGGAIRQAFQMFDLSAALVLNADTLFCIDLDALEARHDTTAAAVTLGLREVADVARFGEVVLDASGRIVMFSEKGRNGRGLINGGIYFVDGRIWRDCRLPESFSFERDYLQKRFTTEAIFGFEGDGYFIDIGVPDDLERARRDLRGR